MIKGFNVLEYWEQKNRDGPSHDYLVDFYQQMKAGIPYPTKEHELRNLQRYWIRECVRDYEWQTLLDAGCGTGFWFQLWKEANIGVTGVDMATSTFEPLQNMKNALDVQYETLTSRLHSLPFPDKHFDVAATIRVLLHIPYEEIDQTLSELGRVASYLMLLEAEVGGTRTKDHVFDHDLRATCESLGFTVLQDEVHSDHQHFFVVKAG